MKKILDFIEYNRLTVIAPLVGLVIWFAAIGCTPLAENPLQAGQYVNAAELETSFSVWQKQQEITMLKFDAAAADIEAQKAAWNEFKEILIALSTGTVADFSGLAQLVLGGGLLGFATDNIRKRGLIAGLKRNKK